METKNEIYKQLINGGKELNFLDINYLLHNFLLDIDIALNEMQVELVDRIEGVFKDRNLTNSEAIKELAQEYEYFNVLDLINMKVFLGEMDECFFSDIKTNKELITIICSRIESFSYFNDYLIDGKLNDGLDIVEYSNHEKCDPNFLMTYFVRDAQFLIRDFKEYYIPELQIKYPLKDEIKIHPRPDNRISAKGPTNNEKLKALKEFCPELIAKLHNPNLNKNEQGQIIYLITGVNKTDAYKKIITSDSKALDNTIIKNDEIDFENLKNKLNNT